MKTKELGILSGDVVCFGMDEVLAMAEGIGYSVEDFICIYSGICCDLGEGNYGIDKAAAITDKGETYPVAVIGLVDGTQRLLQKDEPTLAEYIAEGRTIEEHEELLR